MIRSLIAEAVNCLRERFSECAMKTYSQRIVDVYVGALHVAGQFCSQSSFEILGSKMAPHIPLVRNRRR
jgi:hypothetical protein